MAEGHRRHRGGILWLLDLIEEHQGPLEYDWRTRFHTPLSSLPNTMGWPEALRMVRLLCHDPSAWITAAINGWDYPLSRGDIALIDHYDLTHAANSDPKHKPKPYPRPWPDRDRKIAKPSVSQEQVIAALRAAGHTRALPTAG